MNLFSTFAWFIVLVNLLRKSDSRIPILWKSFKFIKKVFSLTKLLFFYFHKNEFSVAFLFCWLFTKIICCKKFKSCRIAQTTLPKIVYFSHFLIPEKENLPKLIPLTFLIFLLDLLHSLNKNQFILNNELWQIPVII